MAAPGHEPFRHCHAPSPRLGVWLLFTIIAVGARLHAQQLTSIVNIYAPVTAITSCTITVPSTGGFAVGDRILVIQMQGAAVDRSNSVNFGSITGYGNAGHFEFATISSVTPTTIAVVNRLVGAYSVTDMVQVVRVATVANGSVTGQLTCAPWNGSTGGVLAVEASGTLTMNGQIDVSGKGFRGGTALDMNITCGGIVNTDYFYSDISLGGANKGEGIALPQSASARGRGPLANAGGGGNNHNGGGGGGSNIGVGGTGGSEWDNCSSNNPVTRGIPGFPLDYSSGNRVFMGGGGGAGHANNGSGTNGGNGGAIVIIRAATLAGNGQSINSNGADVPLSGPPGADGCGGGGGGGTVLLDVRNYSSNVVVNVKGGAGGNSWWNAGFIGPGGGGGGGLAWSSGGFPPGVTVVAAGGTNGVMVPNGNPWGTTPGSPGGTQGGLVIPEGTQPTVSCSINPTGPLVICDGDAATLTATAGFASYQWSPAGGNGRTAVVRPATSGTYYVTVQAADGCVSVASIDITVLPVPKAHAGPDVAVCLGSQRVIGQDATGGTPPYTYSWDPPAGLSSTGTALVFASPIATTQYVVTVGDSKGECISRDTVLVTVNKPPALAKLRDTTICNGAAITLGAPATGGVAPYTYTWTPSADLDDARKAVVVAHPRAAATRYTVKVTDVNGCATTDSMLVTMRAPMAATAGPDTVVCAGDSIPLRASGGSSYRWSPALGLSCANCANPKAGPPQTTLYAVTIADSNGCVMVDSILVRVSHVGLGATGGTAVDFGTLEGCATSTERTVVLHNTGTDTLRLDSMTFNGTGFAVTSPQLPIRIPGGDSLPVKLQFLPLGTGVTTAVLDVHGYPCNVDYRLDLRGEKALTAVAARPGTIAFGDIYRCDATPRDTTLVIYNTGTDRLSLQGAVVAPPFTILSPSFPADVAPGDSIVIAVRYAPTAAGDYSEQVRLPFSAGPCVDTLRLALGARYLVPMLQPVPAIDFGQLTGCESERDTVITIHNPGNAGVDVTGLALPSGFRIVSPLPVTIAAGGDGQITVRYAPVKVGISNGRLLLAYGRCGDTLAIDVTGDQSGVAYAIPDTVNFGQMALCAGATATRSVTIFNMSAGGVGSSVSDVAISGPFTTTMQNGDTLRNGQPETFTVAFTPAVDGVANGTLDVTIAPCGVKKSIVLTGTARKVAVAGDSQIDFGQVTAGTSGAATAIYRNVGTAVVTVDSIGSPAAPFSLQSTQPPLPATLAPGDSIIVHLGFDASTGSEQSLVRIYISPCSETLPLTVLGEGINRSAWASVSVPVIEAAPGERVVIAPTIDSSAGLPASGAAHFSARLRFNKTLLIPTGSTPQGIITGHERAITITGLRSDTLGAMAPFEFVAALGDTEETPLTLEQFVWTDGGPVTTTVANGLFRLRNLCPVLNTRLLVAAGAAGLKPARPNPASGATVVQYSVMEAGRTRLVVVDLLGRHVLTLVDGAIPPGVYSASFDASGISSGVYFCVLETGVERFVQALRVAR
ncbi:MAG TPA: choice-of-anchor D domain-containing protein [Candidatus Kapabacteria bacterium]|nr:choice-of-anchor D domain-containing protein [Candidatus Kapabacteria bacterium]